MENAQKLPPLTEFQRQQAIRYASPHIAKLNSKSQYVCLDCGHQWHGEKAKTVICPECGRKLKVDTSRKYNFHESEYFAVTRKCNGFQVIRMFFIKTYLKRGSKAVHFIREAFQRWITPAGQNLIVGRRRHWLAYYCDSWDWGSEMELRSEHLAHSVSPCALVGKSSAIPELFRNGFNWQYHDCNPASLFSLLLKDNRIETLWKVGQYDLVRHFMKVGIYHLYRYWPSIRIAIRHHYNIKDSTVWLDLISFLFELREDIHNPKLICPINLQTTHDEYQRRVEVRRARERERRARQQELEAEQRYIDNAKQVLQDQQNYKRSKSKFFDLLFVDKELTIKPLVSIQEFIEEGQLHHHCVFACKYFNKENSLILHAMIDGTSVATIELNLENLEIVQCRGKFNTKPEHYDRIVSLINKNKGQIAQKNTA